MNIRERFEEKEFQELSVISGQCISGTGTAFCIPRLSAA